MLHYFKEYHWRAALRMMVADLLNTCLPGQYCWVGLVMWALSGQPFPRWDSGIRCRVEGAEKGSCYCGLFGPDGVRKGGIE